MGAKRPLYVALIGYSFMGKAHSNAWRQAPRFFDLPRDVVLHTICGRSPQSVEAAKNQFGWQHASTDWKAVVSNPEIDIVDISTPNSTHCEIALEAAKNGKAILCEKPLAITVEECEKMVAAVNEVQVVNMVCHNYRRIPAIAHAKRMIQRGNLGDRIYHVRARYAQDWIADPNFPLTWQLQKQFAGSGVNGDINSHIIDLSRYLVGEISEVCGIMETFIKKRPILEELGEGRGGKAGKEFAQVTVDDAVSWIGRFKEGALANFEATRFAWGRKNHVTLEINGSKGSIFFDLEDMNRLKYFNVDDPKDMRGFRDIIVTELEHPYVSAWWPPGHITGYENTFVNAFSDFVKAVATGEDIQPSFKDGLNNVKVLAAIEESVRSRGWVSV